MGDRIEVSYFSDVLCVWAFVAQIRLDELQRHYGDTIVVHYHFLPIFADTRHRIGSGWKRRGGFEGYAKHVAGVADGFDHVDVADDVWSTVRPTSSAPSHQFLKALQVLETEDVVSRDRRDEYEGRTLFEQTAWTLRRAFFEDGRDISSRGCLGEVTESLDLPVEAMREVINSGRALAGIFRDAELRDEHRIEGSPTYLLSHGRQKLYGNVGYKVIEANVEEILRRPGHAASWC